MGRKLLIRVLDLKRLAIERRDYGPWVVRVGSEVEKVLEDTYISRKLIPSTTQTIRERIMQVEGVVVVSPDPSMPPKAIRLEGVAE